MALLDANRRCECRQLFRHRPGESRHTDALSGYRKGATRLHPAAPIPNSTAALERESHRKLAVSRVVIDSENLAEVSLPDLGLIASATVDVVSMAVKQIVILHPE
jgi:hypothetical protein